MPEQKSEWFAKVAAIANTMTKSNRYTPEDVRNVLKAWRNEYQGRQAAKKLQDKIAKHEAKLTELRGLAAKK